LTGALFAGAATRSGGDDGIILGMSAAFSGPASALGSDMRAGIVAAIEEANTSGGVHGRKLRLVALDDGYEPSRTAPNMRALVGEQKVVAVIGNVGTPTAVAAIPIAVETSTPFVGAYTGAGVLRKTPPDRVVVNFRASYAEEVGAMVDALVTRAGMKPAEIAFFTQRDAYGDAGFSGGIAALRRHGLTDSAAVTHGRYERNTEVVESALADILSAAVPARAVIMVGAYKPCAKFIQLAKQNELHVTFMNVSFVGAGPLAAALGSDGDGVIVTQVVPHFVSEAPLAVSYRAALATFVPDAKPGFGSLEGYAAARMLLLALQKGPDAPDRESVIRSLEGLGKFDLGMGAPLELSATEHQASHQVWPTVVKSGQVEPTSWEALFPRSAGAGGDGR
jgi:ABC-type branched-subunit amino acid transport system substrate-binding protein